MVYGAGVCVFPPARHAASPFTDTGWVEDSEASCLVRKRGVASPDYVLVGPAEQIIKQNPKD